MFNMMKESKKLPIHVRAWMGVMVCTFAAHLFFLDSRLHQISLSAFLITLIIFAPLSFSLTKNINALAATHFVAWPTVLAYGFYQVFVARTVDLTTTAGLVLLEGYSIFLISLILDYRILLSELRIAQEVKRRNMSASGVTTRVGATT